MSKKEREPLTLEVPQQLKDDSEYGIYRGRYFGTLTTAPKYAEL
jgi:hypothetical protein